MAQVLLLVQLESRNKYNELHGGFKMKTLISAFNKLIHRINLRLKENMIPPIKSKFNQKGFAILELQYAIPTICFVFSVAGTPILNYHHDAAVKANLHNVYNACQNYWSDVGSGKECTVSSVSSPEFGFKASSNVGITISGNEWTFAGTGKYLDDNTRIFSINGAGAVSLQTMLDQELT